MKNQVRIDMPLLCIKDLLILVLSFQKYQCTWQQMFMDKHLWSYLVLFTYFLHIFWHLAHFVYNNKSYLVVYTQNQSFESCFIRNALHVIRWFIRCFFLFLSINHLPTSSRRFTCSRLAVLRVLADAVAGFTLRERASGPGGLDVSWRPAIT